MIREFGCPRAVLTVLLAPWTIYRWNHEDSGCPKTAVTKCIAVSGFVLRRTTFSKFFKNGFNNSAQLEFENSDFSKLNGRIFNSIR